MPQYDPQQVEQKWRHLWLTKKLFAAPDRSPKKKMYVLDMFPYPSGDGLHVGHAKIYTASDVASRYLRMQGYEVLHPTGWDAFGLPTENTAIKKGIHPAVLTQQNITRFRQQMQRLGFSYDWDREINTTDPNYYKWTQWIFLQLYKMGLAYQATIPINWCPSCKTGLANEEVIDGACERCGTKVEERPMRQWMLRITKYADRLLEGIGGIDWPQFVKELQENWIGRSEGAQITFAVEGRQKALKVFTTRPDTLFGATYIVLSPGHPAIHDLTTKAQMSAVLQYIQEAQKPIRVQIETGDKEKTGVFTGSYVVHPLNGERLPIWIADYVLMTYGSGAIMAVPAHDARDFEFAQKFNVPVKQVIVPERAAGETSLPFEGEGILINSNRYDGQKSQAAQKKIIAQLQLKGIGQRQVHYRLRDWVFSRQRYWGEPIPVIHCESCGILPVPEEDLPVTLPQVDRYEPTGTGESPLATVKEWVEVKCPNCPRIGRRETNTMPQWAGSSWYWLRYVSPHYDEGIADPKQLERWLPVDLYIGGSEHAVLHLLYARFWQKALVDAGVLHHDEPFKRFRAVGLVIGEDGQKMSKSRGNVINPDDVVAEYGADTLRIYEMFMGPFENSAAWSTEGIRGARRFVERVWNMIHAQKSQTTANAQEDDAIHLKLHQTIKRVTESTEQFRFNTAIAALMEFLNVLEKTPAHHIATLETFVLLLAPYAPHVAEELWEVLGRKQSLAYEKWPQWNNHVLAMAKATIPVQVNGKVRGELQVQRGMSQPDIEHQAKTIENVQRFLAGKNIQKVIYVPDRLVNFVLTE